MDIAQNIRELRKSHKYTQKDLAAILKVKPTSISAWESGRNKPLMDKVTIMAKLFNVSTSDIVGDTFTKANITTIYNQLVPDRQQNVYDYADSQLKEQQASNVIAMPTKEPCSEVEVEGVLSAGIGEQLDDNSGSFTVMVPSPIPANYDHAFQVNGHSMEPVYPDQSIVFVKEEEEYRDGQVVAAIINDDAFIKKLSIDCGHATLLSLNPAYPDVKVDEDEGVRIIGVVFK